MTLEKGDTVLKSKLRDLGLDEAMIAKVVVLMRDWAVDQIIQIDEYTILKGEPFETLNRQYDISNHLKQQMRDRVKSQTKLEGSIQPTLFPE